MGRGWIVAVIVCIGAVAEADPRSACRCGASLVVPARGAVVPPNARIWVFDELDRTGRLDSGSDATPVDGTAPPFGGEAARVVMFQPALAPRTDYSFSAGSQTTTFTTTGDADTTPPDAPTVTHAAITVRRIQERSAVVRFSVDIALAPDAALVRITVKGAAGETTLFTVPGRRELCDPDLWVAPGILMVSFVAIDIAGNESPATTIPIIAVAEPDPGDPCLPHHTGRPFSTGMLGVFLVGLVAVVGAVIGIPLIVIRRRIRGVNDPLASREPKQVSLLVAEHLARGARARDALITTLLTAAIASCLLADIVPALFGLIFVIAYLVGIATATRVLRMLEQPDATAELRNGRLFVCAGQLASTIAVSPNAIARARRRAVPTSIVKR